MRAACWIACWLRCQASVGLPLRADDGDGDQPVDVLADDLPDAPLDLGLGLVVAAAEPVAHALELLFCLRQRALARGGDLGLLLGGVDVGDAEALAARRSRDPRAPSRVSAPRYLVRSFAGSRRSRSATCGSARSAPGPSSAAGSARAKPVSARSGTMNRRPARSI